MAAGLGFKTFTTGEVLTAADTNGYLMQGILVFASSAARASAITSPQEGQYSYLKDTNALEYYDGAAWVGAPVGDITAVTAGKGLTGGGSSGDVTVSLGTTAKGDLVAGTGTTTAGVLSVGTNGQTLVADSTAATGLKWATASSGGGMTLISTTTLSGASISLTSIAGTYKNLVVVVQNYKPATNGEYLIGQFNTDTGTNYRDVTATVDAVGAADRANLTVSFEASSSVSNSTQNWTIYDYANTTTYKQAETISWNTNKTTTANMNFIHRNHLWYNTAAITSIQLKPSAGNFTSGTALLYGVS